MSRAAECSRHSDRTGSYAVVLNYIGNQQDWRSPFHGAQLLDALCEDCRIELIHWMSERQPVDGSA